MADKAAEPKGNPMIYPYTMSAKVIQFPWKFFFNNSWVYKNYVLAVLVTIPVFHKISKMANSPENKKKWKEIRERDWSGPHH